MATLAAKNYYTLMDLLNQKDSKGNAAIVAEILNENNPMLQDAPWEEANDTFSYTFTRRLSLPKGSWRDINEGVATEASHTKRATEYIGMLESYSEVDKTLVDNHPSPAKFRMTEASAFIEGMSQTLAKAIIYGNPGMDPTPKIITGLAPRLNSLAQDNVIDCGGTGVNLTSLYIVQWGPTKTFMFHPKSHTNKGIDHKDLGEHTLFDTNNQKYQGYRDHFAVHCGLGVKDERCIFRIANINVAATKGTAGYFNEDLLIEALDSMPNNAAGAIIYAPREVMTMATILMKDKGNVNFTADSGNGLSGMRVVRFLDIPFKKVDAISTTETQVV